MKLDYILNPDNRLYEIEFGNRKNLDDGFVCHLRPLYLNSDDEIWKKMAKDDSMTVLIENETGFAGEGYGVFGYDYIVRRAPPDIHVKVCFKKGELTEAEISEVSGYINLQYIRQVNSI